MLPKVSEAESLISQTTIILRLLRIKISNSMKIFLTILFRDPNGNDKQSVFSIKTRASQLEKLESELDLERKERLRL
jgi:hypothetical protein